MKKWAGFIFIILITGHLQSFSQTNGQSRKSLPIRSEDFLDSRPQNLEVILTGRDPGEELLKRADYISEIRMIRHPISRGQKARGGIER